MIILAYNGDLRVACAALARTQDVWPWYRDLAVSEGTGQLAESTATIDLSLVDDPAPPAIYRSGWESNDSGIPVKYRVTGLKPESSYTVRAHFCAETGSAGKYLFAFVTYGIATVTTTGVDPEDDPGINTARIIERSVQPSALGNIELWVQPTAEAKSAQLCGFEIRPPSLVIEPLGMLVSPVAALVPPLICDTVAVLKASYQIAARQMARTLGRTTAGDGFGREYWFDDSSSLTDDGFNVLLPNSRTAITPGRWRILP